MVITADTQLCFRAESGAQLRDSLTRNDRKSLSHGDVGSTRSL